MKPGQLVMLIKPMDFLEPNSPDVGAIGEVIDHSGKPEWYIHSACVVVSFPRNLSLTTPGYWSVIKTKLVPISDPDIEIEAFEEETTGAPAAVTQD